MADGRQIPTDTVKLGLSELFCASHDVASTAVPLFETEDHCVVSHAWQHDPGLFLKRSSQMEHLVIREAGRVLDDGSPCEGILYMMLWKEEGLVQPLYVGRAGRYGRNAEKVSANLKNIERDRSKFARWGSGYAYHIGDLSAAACPDHAPAVLRPKYARWASGS